MTTSTYLKVCAGAVAIWVLGLMFVPSFGEALEGLILLFLSTNAR